MCEETHAPFIDLSTQHIASLVKRAMAMAIQRQLPVCSAVSKWGVSKRQGSLSQRKPTVCVFQLNYARHTHNSLSHKVAIAQQITVCNKTLGTDSELGTRILKRVLWLVIKTGTGVPALNLTSAVAGGG
jgi:hypothetical protein